MCGSVRYVWVDVLVEVFEVCVGYVWVGCCVCLGGGGFLFTFWCNCYLRSGHTTFHELIAFRILPNFANFLVHALALGGKCAKLAYQRYTSDLNADRTCAFDPRSNHVCSAMQRE